MPQAATMPKGLRPITQMTPEEQLNMRKKMSEGHAKAAEKRKAKQTFREALEWVLDLPAMESTDPYVESLRAEFPNLTNREAMAIALARKTVEEKSARAFVVARDTTGELPEQLVNVKTDVAMVINVKTVDGLPQTALPLEQVEVVEPAADSDTAQPSTAGDSESELES